MSSTWHVPFSGRNHSGAVRQNFLWGDGRVFIMDNHRAALWCWLRCTSAGSRYGLLHIDERSDALGAWLPETIALLPGDLRELGINDSLALSRPDVPAPVPLL